MAYLYSFPESQFVSLLYFQQFPYVSHSLFQLGNVGIVEMPGAVDAAANLVDVRGGTADGGKGVAVCLMYEEGDDVLTFDEEVVYLAEAPNFLAGDEEVPAIIEDEEVDE